MKLSEALLIIVVASVLIYLAAVNLSQPETLTCRIENPVLAERGEYYEGGDMVCD